MTLPQINIPTRVKNLEIPDLNGGLNIADDAFNIKDNEISSGLNVDFFPNKLTGKRLGSLKYNDIVLKNTGRIDGLHAFYKLNTRIVIAAIANELINVGRTSNTGITVSGETLDSGTKWDFLDWNEAYVIMVNGAQRPMWWNGTNNVWRLGIDAPTAAPTAADADPDSGSLDTGANYFYYYTYYNSTTGTESNASPQLASAVQTATGAVDITIAVNASIDPQVDTVRLYRTSGGDASTADHKLTASAGFSATTLATVAVTVQDTVADSALSTVLHTDHNTAGQAASTNFKNVMSVNNRLFLIGETGNTHKLYFSKLGDPEYFPTLNVIIIEDAQGEPTGLWRLGNQNLVIFFESSVHMLTGAYSPNAIQVMTVTTNVGNLSAKALGGDEAGVYFVAYDGIYYFDGRNPPVKVSPKIAPYFEDGDERQIDALSLRNSAGTYRKGKYYFSFSEELRTSTDTILALTTDIANDSGSNRSTASISSDHSLNNLESGTDAVMTLTQTQASERSRMDVEVFIPFTDDSFAQKVQYEIFVSKDSRTTWTSKGTFTAEWREGITGLVKPVAGYDYSLPINRYRSHSFEEFNVTDVRVDLYFSVSGKILLNNRPSRITSVTLGSIKYFFENTAITVENDRTLVFHRDSLRWTPVWKGLHPNYYSVWNKGNDADEIFIGDSRSGKGFVRQIETGPTDDGVNVFASLQSKQFNINRSMLSNVYIDLFPSNAVMTLSVFIDFKQRLKRDLRFEFGEEATFDNEYHDGFWFSDDKAFEEKPIKISNLAKGKYLAIEITNSDIHGFLFRSIRFRVHSQNIRY